MINKISVQISPLFQLYTHVRTKSKQCMQSLNNDMEIIIIIIIIKVLHELIN